MPRYKETRTKAGCDACAAIKRVVAVKIAHVHLNLCERCRLELSKIIREREKAKVDARRSRTLDPAPGIDDDLIDADLEAGLVGNGP